MTDPIPPRNHTVPQRHLGQGPDSDGDGLSDEFERRWGSNPNAVDPDGDGLSDWVEWNLDTDPNDRDTDGDGWEDGEDLAFGDPLRTNTGGAERKAFIERVRAQFAAEGSDRDGDLVRDYLEVQEGTRSDNPDSDGDGLSDLTEIQLRRNGVSTSQHSTPDDVTDLDSAMEELGRRRWQSDSLTSSADDTAGDDMSADDLSGFDANDTGALYPADESYATTGDSSASYDDADGYDTADVADSVGDGELA